MNSLVPKAHGLDPVIQVSQELSDNNNNKKKKKTITKYYQKQTVGR